MDTADAGPLSGPVSGTLRWLLAIICAVLLALLLLSGMLAVRFLDEMHSTIMLPAPHSPLK